MVGVRFVFLATVDILEAHSSSKEVKVFQKVAPYDIFFGCGCMFVRLSVVYLTGFCCLCDSSPFFNLVLFFSLFLCFRLRSLAVLRVSVALS